MLIFFIIISIVGALGLLALGAGIIGKDGEIAAIGGVVVALFVIITLFMSYTNVDAKNVGIVRTGGHVSSSTLSPGVHFIAPWKSVNEVDGTEQFEKYHDENGIDVSLGDRSNTKMSVTVRWQINTDKANEIYSRFRGDNPVETFRDRVVSPQIISAAVDAAQSYNPLAQLKSIDPQKLDKGFEFKVDYTALAEQIKAQVQQQTLGLAEIISVTVTKLPLSDASQSRVNTFIASISDTLIAQQKVKTAEQEALANEKLADSLKANPSVNVANCFKLVADSPAGTFPAGFQCQPGGSGSVVIPSK